MLKTGAPSGPPQKALHVAGWRTDGKLEGQDSLSLFQVCLAFDSVRIPSSILLAVRLEFEVAVDPQCLQSSHRLPLASM